MVNKKVYMKYIRLFCFLICLSAGSLAAQQTFSIQGQVIDTYGRPLSGAAVSINGLLGGVATDSLGAFALLVSRGDTLAISYIGYQEQQIIIDSSLPQPLVIDLSVDKTMSTNSIVVYATRPPVMANTPAPVMSLGAIDLNRDDRLSIQPALNRIPGLLMHSGALNTNRITIRGIGNRSPFATAKIRAYLNDIPLTSGVGETSLEDLDLSLVDRIDIWKGPTASIYGAGLGGMIHLHADGIETRRGPQVEASLGAFGASRLAVGWDAGNSSKKLTNKWQLRLRYHRLHSDGYRENNEYDRNGLALLAQRTSAGGGQTTLLGNWIDLKAFIPSSLNRQDFLTDPRQAAFTWAQVQGFEDYRKLLAGLSHHQPLWQDRDGRSRLSNISSVFFTHFTQYESRPFNILTEDNTAIGGRTRFDYRPAAAQPWKMQLGLEYFDETYDWQTYRTDDGRQDTLRSDNTERRRYYNLFWETQLSLGQRMQLEAGLNVNNTRYDLTDRFLRDGNDQSGDHRFATVLSPRLGMLLRLPRALRLFATISHGFSPPSLEETLTPEGSVNPDIQPEKGWNYEIGLRRNEPARRFNFELTAYTMHIRDLLVARRTALDQYIGINAGATRHSGLETYLHYVAMGWGTERPVSVFASYTFSNYRFTEFIDDEQDYSGNELTGTPPHQLSLGLDYLPQAGGPYGHLNWRLVDAMPIRDDNSIYSEAFQVLNLKLGYRYLWSADQHLLDAYFGINNMLDEQYASMLLVNAASFGGAAPRYYYPGLPRHIYVGVRLAW